jgi:primase-polymerase (primpol)-like protein
MKRSMALGLAVPDDLAELDQWVLWRYEEFEREGKPRKIPYTVRGRRASTTDPQDWASFELALRALQANPHRYAGLGFVFSAQDPFTGIDLDDCLEESGNPKRWAQSVLERFADTYAEISPSGRGVKIWSKATLGRAEVLRLLEGSIELYDRERYFCVTGRAFRGAPLQIEDHAADVRALAEWLTRRPNANGTWAANPNAQFRIPAGQRHAFLVSLAGTLHKRRLLPEIIEATLRLVNERMCRPPKPDQEISKIARDSTSWP